MTKLPLLYGSPAGSGLIINPSAEILRDHLFDKPETFWAPKSGTVKLQIPPADHGLKGDDVRFSQSGIDLLITRKDRYGIMLTYESSETAMPMVAISSTDFSKMTSLYPQGIRWPVPIGMFVAKERAWEAIVEFMETGRMSDKLTWEPMYARPWGQAPKRPDKKRQSGKANSRKKKGK